MDPAPLMPRARPRLVEGLPEPERSVTHRDLGRDREAARLDVDQELAPALGALPHSDLKAHEFLPALRCGADEDEHALGLGLHPGLEVDTVRPDIHVAAGQEVAALPALVVRLPLSGQSRQHPGREVGRVLPEQSRQGFLEVAGGDPAQVQDRQQGIEAAGPPCPSRQDGRGEPKLALRRSLSSIPDLRPPHRQTADPGLDLALGSLAVSDDPLAAVRQALLGQFGDKGIGLRPQRRRQHPARALPGNLGQRIVHRMRLTERDDLGIFCHGVSLPSEVLTGLITRLDTPPSQTPSPIFEYSSR